MTSSSFFVYPKMGLVLDDIFLSVGYNLIQRRKREEARNDQTSIKQHQRLIIKSCAGMDDIYELLEEEGATTRRVKRRAVEEEKLAVSQNRKRAKSSNSNKISKKGAKARSKSDQSLKRCLSVTNEDVACV